MTSPEVDRISAQNNQRILWICQLGGFGDWRAMETVVMYRNYIDSIAGGRDLSPQIHADLSTFGVDPKKITDYLAIDEPSDAMTQEYLTELAKIEALVAEKSRITPQRFHDALEYYDSVSR